MITVACVLKKSKMYDSTWVTKLKNSVERNVTIPYEFVALSDCEVPCKRIPLIDSEKGWWAKMELFRPNLFNTPVLYLDLDIVICQNIDDIISKLLNENTFHMKKFTGSKDRIVSQSSMLYWSGDYSYLYEKYKSNPGFFRKIFSKKPLIGDQAMISENVDHKYIDDYFPPEYFYTIGGGGGLKGTLEDVKILDFIKSKYKPHLLLDHPLVASNWR